MKLLALLGLTACSFAAVRSPHGSPPACTESNLAPVIDTLAIIAAPFLTYALVHSSSRPEPHDDELGDLGDGLITIAIATPIMAGFTTSAVYGFIKTSRCRDVKAAYGQPLDAP